MADTIPAQLGYDPAVMAAIGRQVRDRLANNPHIRRVPSDLAEIYVAEKFLSPNDCRRIIRIINSRAVPSPLYRGKERAGLRTSSTHYFEPGNDYTTDLERYICEVTGLSILHAESMQGQRYKAGQHYGHHHDFFPLGDGYWQQERAVGGQRSWTAMINLNAPREGGETDFPLLGLRFAPQPGQLLVWNNMDPAGRPNMKTLHSGLPVGKGIKHIVTLWFRQEPWRIINC